MLFKRFTYPQWVGQYLGACCLLAGIFLLSSGDVFAQINYNCKVMNANFTDKNGWLTDSRISGVFGLNKQGSTQGLGTNGRTTMQNGYLRTKMPKNKVLGQETGFRFDLTFPSSTEAEFRYRVKFEGNYHWTMGGKLPGLGGGGVGGKPPRGCTANNDDGFSARLMFRNNSMNAGTNRTTAYMISYIYDHTLAASECGYNYEWDDNTSQSGIQRVEIERNTWYEFRQYIKISSAGSSNGRLKTWYRECSSNNSCSGSWKRVENYSNMPWKKSGRSFNIDQILMETYHGGSGSDWTPQRNNYIQFDDFVLYRKQTCSSNLAPNTIGDGLINVVNVEDFGYDDEDEALTLSVIPNPVSAQLSIVKQTMTDGTMSIVNLQGKVINSWKVVAGETNSSVDVGDLPAGMYMVRYAADGQMATQKFIKN